MRFEIPAWESHSVRPYGITYGAEGQTLAIGRKHFRNSFLDPVNYFV